MLVARELLIHLVVSSLICGAKQSEFVKEKNKDGIFSGVHHQLQCGKSGCRSPWSFCNNGTCECSTVPDHILQCSLRTNLTVVSCYCVTYDESAGVTEAGACVYNCGRTRRDDNSIARTFPADVAELNDHLCAPFNRTGTLCGNCKDGHYLLAHSFDMNCVKCQNGKYNWWRYLLSAYLPLTFFYFLVVFFKINMTSSPLHGFVHYSQGLSIPALVRVMLVVTRNLPELNMSVRVIGMFYSFWTLDFFRSIRIFSTCLQLDILNTFVLDLGIGVYPLLLMLVSYFLIHMYDSNCRVLVFIWKPFRKVFGLFRQQWEIKTSLIDAFATFFLLSNIKFLSVSFDILAPLKVYQLNSTGHVTYSWRLLDNATIPYLGEQHLPYAVLAVAVLTLFILLPTLLLIIYPCAWFQKFLRLFPFRWYVLHTFMDAFQGCYKDGTKPGTKDCRWFAATFFITRFVIVLLGSLVRNSVFFPMASMVVIIQCILMATIQPFKPNLSHHSVSHAIFMLLLALFFACYIGNELVGVYAVRISVLFMGVVVCIALAPLLYVTIITVKWLHKHWIFGLVLIREFSVWRRGYSLLD